MIDNYRKDEFGIIHQIKTKSFIYDEKYVIEYNKFKEKTKEMSYLRLGYLMGVIGKKPNTILDYGYGNGAFLEVCQSADIECYGTDISGYSIPKDCKFIEADKLQKYKFEVVCFFDSLEHLDDISFLKHLNTKFIYISLPWCHQAVFGDNWFKTWKHLKPNEHLHHFDEFGIKNYMNSMGYDCINIGNPEDCIRISAQHQNILSGIFRKT